MNDNGAPVGAGLPANTGEAGAIHRVTCFAGKPALTGCAQGRGMNDNGAPVGAGLPANTGEAGAIHRVTCF
ncbi:hypothetical protein NJH47_26090, partial [Pseudomonas guariconensis]|uniref:hypothetical protein n=1 Tax=Pseudomonas TaxID=286 RepID=UPI002097F6F2